MAEPRPMVQTESVAKASWLRKTSFADPGTFVGGHAESAFGLKVIGEGVVDVLFGPAEEKVR